jgi:hypothetical protein
MNSAFYDKQAGKGVGGIARQALRAALACALALGSAAALAQQHGDRDPGSYGGGYGGGGGGNYGGGNYGNPQPQPERHAERFRLPQTDREPRQEAPRGYDDPRRMQAYPQPQQAYPQPYAAPQQERRGGGRSMTPDERAEMRRQINEAKDLYPQRH